MCGIAGIVHADRAADPALLGRMLDALVHRGPDAEGRHVDGPVALGMRRLSVIDPAGGEQPLRSEDGRIVLVGNGELYDEPPLRAALRARGHRFGGGSDLEVLVHLWEEHGPDALHHVRGMFAVALWDDRRRELVLARDRVGKKPLYWALHDGGLRFGSEPRALLQDPTVPRDVDPRALDAFLANGYVPHDRSAFAALRRLAPGSALRWRPGEQPRVWRWWRPSRRPALRVSAEEATALVADAVDEAVRVRMRADVPLGAFLSGGLDSSLVVDAMARQATGPVRTFSVSFAEADVDESRHAAAVAAHAGAEHHDLRLRALDAALLPRVAWHCGEPFADPAVLATFALAERTRRTVTVALNGDGGDEAFGGYRRYRQLAATRPVQALPPAARRALAAALAWAAGGTEGRAAGPRAARLARRLALDPGRRYADLLRLSAPAVHRGLLTADARAAIGDADPQAHLAAAWDAAESRDWTARAMETDLTTYLSDDLLPKVDLASMAHGLEVRSPLLDHELLELAARLPPRLLRDKLLLRRVARARLPAAIVARPKQGFALPLAAWLRGELRPLAQDVLLDPRAAGRGIVRPAAVEALLRRHAAGEDHAMALWALLSLELWFRTCVDAAPTAAPALLA